MTINIETLRFEIQLNKLDNSQMVLSPLVVGELLDRLEAAEQTVQDYLRIDREKSQIAQRLEAAEKERDECNSRRLEAADHFAAQTALMKEKCDALRAKIEAMEQQKPVGTLHDDGCFVWRETAPHQSNYAGWKMVLYALPGAQGEEK